MKIIRIRSKTIQLQPGDKFTWDGTKLIFYPIDPAVLSIKYRYAGATRYGGIHTRKNLNRTFTPILKDLLGDILAAKDHFDVTQEQGTKTYTFKNLRAEN